MTYQTPAKVTHRDLPATTADQWKRQTIFGAERDELLDLLPESARAKLVAIRAEAEQLRASTRTPYEAAKKAVEKKHAIERRIDELLRGGYQGYTADHPHVVAEREALEATKSEIFRLQHQADAARPTADQAGHLVTNLHDYVRSAGPRLLTVALAPEIAAPKPAKGESIVDAIEHIREKIANLAAEIQNATDAPITSTEAKKIARDYIERMAESGRPNVLVTLEARLPPEFPTPHEQRFPGEIDLQSVLAWLHRDSLVEALEREIDLHAADDAALSDDERAKRIAAFSAEKLALERQEESLIVLARQNFNPVARRADADPRAVLGLADTAPAPRPE